MGCLGHLAAVADARSLTAQRQLAAQTLEIMEKYGWMSEPIARMVLATMASADVGQGRFDDAQPWLDRAEQRSLRPNAEPAKELIVRYVRGICVSARDASRSARRIRRGATAPIPDGDARPADGPRRGLEVQTLVRMGDVPAARAALARQTDAGPRVRRGACGARRDPPRRAGPKAPSRHSRRCSTGQHRSSATSRVDQRAPPRRARARRAR